MNLTCVILTKNNEKSIKEVVESVNFAEEIILVDDFSKDKTPEIAKKLGAKVYQRHLNDDFSKQRNFGLSKAKGNWVLFVDADETVTPMLRKELMSLSDSFDGYYLDRKNLFLGKVVGRDRLLRVAKKGFGKWERIVHEVWRVKGKIGNLNGELIHYTAGNLNEVIAKTNFYSTLHAGQNEKEGKSSSLFKIIFFPKAKLIQNLLTDKGFIFALVHSFHSFLAWSKLWLLQRDSTKKQ